MCYEQGVHKWQVELAHKGDNVSYALARTVRSNIQYQAAMALGAKGADNQCKRGGCMEAAMCLCSSGKGFAGIPKPVVQALLQYKTTT